MNSKLSIVCGAVVLSCIIGTHSPGLLAAGGVQVVVPGQAELAGVAVVDLVQRAVALLVIGPPVGHPVAGLAVGVEDPLAVHVRAWRFMVSRKTDQKDRRQLLDGLRSVRELYEDGGDDATKAA